jgi:thiol:disulfide interchange protein DsbA
MRLIQKLLFAIAALSFAATGATASPAAPQNGVEYQTLQDAQTTDAGSKVEVIEFFSYACPHCYAFEPMLAAWSKKNGDKVSFKRIHVGFNAGDLPLQRMFATLEAMGVTEQHHAKAFSAIHEERQRLNSDEGIFDWASRSGIDRDKFVSAYRSFGTQVRVNRLKAMTDAYRVDNWPRIAVAGKYITTPFLASSSVQPQPSEKEQQQMALQVMDHLVAKAKAEKK